MYASESGAQDCVELLLKRGAKKDVEDYEGLTGMKLPRRKKRLSIWRLQPRSTLIVMVTMLW